MRLTKFKVENFRSVVDSGWVDAERVTALIGVNESGKTNLLLPLWKLNPAREGEIRPTSDYPKGNYAKVREAPQKFYFIHAHFEIGALATEISKMTGINPEFLNVIYVAKNYSGHIWIGFPNYNKPSEASSAELLHIIDQAHADIASIEALAEEGNLKTAILDTITIQRTPFAAAASCPPEMIAVAVTNLNNNVPEEVAPTSSLVPRLKRLSGQLSEIENHLKAPPPGEVKEVKDLIIKNLPKFVYYSNYGNLDSEIYLPHVVENLKRDDLGAREAAKARTLRVLFSFVRLKPEEILELGRDFKAPDNRKPTPDEISAIATKKRERTILLNSAGTDLTKRFRDWWKQGDYTFEFQADGDHFRIWVSDSKRPEKVELEDRSSGLQWFLSFYLVFLVESRGEHRDAILLLDEPGLSLHPLAQRDLSAFFENLAKTNQLVYTTHSPFLVDADMLDRVRKVYMGKDGSTLASADLRLGTEDPRKSGATYAIYSALNMTLAESMLYGCRPIIVEGPSDQHYLSTIKTILIGKNRISPKREIVFPPSHGAANAKVVASILSGKDEVLPLVLLDGDDAGKKMARDLQNGLYQSDKSKVKTTDAYVGFEKSEIEDLIPTEFFAAAIDRWERKPETPFAEVARSGNPIVPQVEVWAKSQGVDLYDGWKVDVAREIKRRALSSDSFGDEVLSRWSKLFDDLLA